MKQFYLKCLLLGIFSLVGIKAAAYDCKVNGIYYNLDATSKTASVTHLSVSGNDYSGSVTIPSSIIYNGTNYSVTSIGDYAFVNCSYLTSIEIPSSVTNIGEWAFVSCTGLKKVIVKDIAAWCKINFSSNSREFTSNPLCYAHHLYSDENTEITDLIIPSSVTSIGARAFRGCSALTSVTIPSSVTSIGDDAFKLCSGLTTVTINSNAILSKNYSSSSSLKNIFGEQVTKYVIGENVTSIGDCAFSGCSGLTSVVIPSNVTSIGDGAFIGCSGLTKVIVRDIAAWCYISFEGYANPLAQAHHLYSDENTEITELIIPSSVTSIGDRAFSGCWGLTSVTIPNSVTNIGDQAFLNCSGLTSVTIGMGVTSIGASAFAYCSGLTSIVIPSSVTNIGRYAFDYCTGLTSVTIGMGVTSIGERAFVNCRSLNSVTINSNAILSNSYLKDIFGEQVTKYVIGENVTSIGNNAFWGCSNLTSVEIPSSVTSIGYQAFSNCTGLTSVTIGMGVISIGARAFEGCRCLTSIVIPSSVKSIGECAFRGCSGLNKVIVKDISAWCIISFDDQEANPLTWAHRLYNDENTEITELIIPNSVTSIGEWAFWGCNSLTSVAIGNNVTDIGRYAFPNTAKILVNKGTKSLITLWNRGINAYNIATGEQIPPSSISLVSSAQVSVTVTVADYYDGYTYTINDEIVNKGKEKTYSGISHSLTLCVSLGDVSYTKVFTFKSKGLDLTINASTTSSSINVMCSYTHGDAVVTTEEIYMNGIKVSDGNTYYISGLNPNTTYTIMYSTNFESISEKVRTAPLILTTSQPKVISSGNVVVAAETNLDNEETNVGFEWRRTDWTDDFTSNSGTAYLYNGTMEGYIRNLNTEKLWKYRPYYTSNAGYSYYGEWVGIDPTNTSYFEPTVHTYANVSVNGNSAEVKGYVQRGTDNVVSKGFAYWKQSENVKGRKAVSAPSMVSGLPSNAKTVEVSGSQQVMTASISNLEYETTYCYVAFVRTSEGDTFYGEPREFTTDIDVTGIRDVDYNKTVTVIQRYDQNGLRISSPRRGLNILLMSDGSTKKVWVK